MKITEITNYLESIAPLALQEKYDNAGLITGDHSWLCSGILITLDITEEIVNEAIEKGCNLIVSHHPIIFTGLKNINGSNYVEKTIIRAIKNDIALYAIHTNLDNINAGVNGRIAEKLGMINCEVLCSRNQVLQKLFVYVPVSHAELVRASIFNAGGGDISNYSECSFNTAGQGTFKPQPGTQPYVGKVGERHIESEIKIEIIFPSWLRSRILTEMLKAHPYEDVAYDIISLDNYHQEIGAGLIGDLPEPIEESAFLALIKNNFKLSVIKHTKLIQKMVRKVAICGGAGSFLIKHAQALRADMYLSSDIKYHDFFDTNDKMIIADIGHYESEQFTIELLYEILSEKFHTFAIQKTEITTNPVFYYL